MLAVSSLAQSTSQTFSPGAGAWSANAASVLGEAGQAAFTLAPSAANDAVDAALNAGGGGRSAADTLRIGTAFNQQLEDNSAVLALGTQLTMIERTYREEFQSAGELALLNMDVYLDSSNPLLLPAGYTALSDKQAETEFPGFTAQDGKSGFYSRIYKDEKSGDTIVVNRGTNDASAPIGIIRGTPDGQTNAALLGGNRTHQADLALRNASVVSRATGGHVRFSGHSLGGALASLQGAATQAPTTVFNPLGLNKDLFTAYNLKQSDFDRNVRAYVVDGEPVALANWVLGLERTEGTQKIPSREIEGVDGGDFRTSAKNDDPHSMVAILAGLSYRFHW
ncbi:hypothetical protein ABVV53_13080 [Novosphingobium sp. RD2P27]|uniref:Uncharacterized protein n=1 Tax=Novosphingobium kalidii TaxID=3230299 RepID=A0ABV2D3D4_9SPHN